MQETTTDTGFGSRKNASPLGLDVHPVVFWTSAALIVFFVILSVWNAERMQWVFDTLQREIVGYTGWFYILSVNIFLVFAIYLAFSRFGSLRLGGEDARPEFTRWGWFAMLFAAGMGIGLLFYGVAEPILHYTDPPFGAGDTVAAAKLSMTVTFFHWGLHAWGIFAVVGLSLAFFAYRRGLPLAIRSAFYPLIGERVHGAIGNVIDILAVVATLFGVATSLGLGAQQVNAGLNFVFGVPQEVGVQIPLIIIITAMALTSVVLGLDKGIRRLSIANMWLAIALLVFVFLLGPTQFLLDSLFQNMGDYIQRLPALSTWNEAYQNTHWQDNWTIFYWGWWISWSPFVGMFIARISYGRTIREFLIVALLVPTLITVVWLTVFGGSALFEQLYGSGGISEAVNTDVTTALFVLLDRYPLAMLTSIVAISLVIVFFVTSSDSASLVIDIIAAGGKTNPPVQQRIFWAILQGVVAAVLLFVGGLKALQVGAITTALPFIFVLLVMCLGLYRGLQEDMPVRAVGQSSGS